MKAVTLTQPYATLCVCVSMKRKELETRKWLTWYRGPLLIHAGKGAGYFKTEAQLWQCCLSEPFRTVLAECDIWNPGRLPRGELVGAVDLTRIYRIHKDHLEDVVTHETRELPGEHERSFGDYTPERFAWQFERPRPFAKSIPVRGLQGLWNYDGPLPEEVSA